MVARCCHAVAAVVLFGASVAASPAWAQDQPPAPRQAPHHATHPHHRRRHHAPAPKPAASAIEPAPVQPPNYADAPTPNANLLPPKEDVPSSTSVLPGTMQLHYPPSGEGYVPGSSPQAMDDARTAKVPGVELHVPLQPDAPQPLPPPQDASH